MGRGPSGRGPDIDTIPRNPVLEELFRETVKRGIERITTRRPPRDLPDPLPPNAIPRRPIPGGASKRRTAEKIDRELRQAEARRRRERVDEFYRNRRTIEGEAVRVPPRGRLPPVPRPTMPESQILTPEAIRAPLPRPSAPSPVPAPRIPDSVGLPQPAGSPRSAPQPTRGSQTRPRGATRPAANVGAFPMFGPILRRARGRAREVFPVFSQPAADPLGFVDPLTAAVVEAAPELRNRLTTITQPGVSFFTPQPLATRSRERDCECEEPEEREKRPSAVVAAVKGFKRRMSQYSLDNLRKG
jgi:hypothetical protein